MGLRSDVVEIELRETIRRLTRELAEAKAKREELVRAVYEAATDAFRGITVPPVRPPKSDARHAGDEEAVVVLSDWQLGKETPSYNIDVAASRMEELATKVEKITRIQRSDHPVRRCHLFVLGDLVEGERIFPGQAWEIDASLYRQMQAAVSILANFTRRMLAAFDSVTIHAVDGNHGRLGRPGEYHPETNADRMVYWITKLLLKDEPRVSWNFADGPGSNWYVVAKIGRYTSLLVHGNQFRGTALLPWYSIQKKAGGWALGAIMDLVDSLAGDGDVDLDFGHWHQPTRMTLNRLTARCNGSLESHNPYAQEQLAAVGRPSQGLRFVHPERGMVTAEYTVWLE